MLGEHFPQVHMFAENKTSSFQPLTTTNFLLSHHPQNNSLQTLPRSNTSHLSALSNIPPLPVPRCLSPQRRSRRSLVRVLRRPVSSSYWRWRFSPTRTTSKYVPFEIILMQVDLLLTMASRSTTTSSLSWQPSRTPLPLEQDGERCP